jgi:2-polyprenyl-3-methyl-5-hydroxy-6-metoxy-1,4-benzoquinol methylase
MTTGADAGRDHNREYQDVAAETEGGRERKYAYDFDYVHRGYMMRAFAPFLPSGRALEMGCYLGEFTKLLAARFDDLTVVEAASDLIAAAREQPLGDAAGGGKLGDRVRFICSTFEALNTDERYDAIFLMHTLEHLDDPVGVLRKVNGWLSERGLLFLVVPNANAPSRQIAVKMGLIAHNSAVTDGEARHGHRRTYAFDTLEHDARAAGLRVAHRGGVFFKPLANYQFDKLMKTDIIDQGYLDGCYELGMQYPDLCASIYLLCGKGGAP